MSGTAALVFGVVALYTLALDGVNWVRTTVDFPSDASTLKAQLDIQIEAFECWGRSSGIACGEIVPYLNETKVSAVLSAIHAITASIRKLEDQHSILSPGSPPLRHTSTTIIPEPQMLRARRNTERTLSDNATIGNRMRWTFWDKGKVEKLVQELHTFNQVLGLLYGPQLQALKDEIRTLQARVVSTDDLERLRVVQHASDPHNHAIRLSAELKIARIKLEAEFDERRSLNISLPTTDTLLQANLLSTQTSTKLSSFSLCSYDQKSAIAEWRPYGTTGKDEGARRNRIERISALASLLGHVKPAKLRALVCLGYLEDVLNFRFCLVFAWPDTIPTVYHPRSLLQILDTSRPSLTERLFVARELADCVFEMFVVDWYHKSLRPQNLLFFQDPTDSSGTTLPSSFLSDGV